MECNIIKLKRWGSTFLIYFLLFDFSSTEWVVNQISLPPYSKQEPDNFTLSLMWASNNKITSNHIKLNLLKSKAVDKSIPIYTNDNDGKPQLVTISKQNSRFYHDLSKQASMSLTNLKSQKYELKGSFILDNERFELEVYNPFKHKAMSTVERGSYIITKPQQPNVTKLADYASIPESFQRKKKARPASQSTSQGRRKRQTTTATTYIIQLYIAVDYFLYQKLTESAAKVNWTGTALEYTAFVIGHIANEIDVRYRNIDA